MNTYKMKVGLFGIGLETYWKQFDGLEQRLTRYLSFVENKLASYGHEIINLGLIDNTQKSFDGGHTFRKEDVDIIFLYVTTYALSATVLPIVRKANVPVIILNLAPTEHLDYDRVNDMKDRVAMTGEWLAYCSACPVPEIANVFKRSNFDFHQVTGVLENDPHVWREVEEWLDAAKVAHQMAHNRLGLMGNYYGGMLDIYTDLTLQLAKFGGHIEVLEVDELSSMRVGASEIEIEEKLTQFHTLFDIESDCSPQELRAAAITSVALDKMVDRYQLGSLAYYHKGSGNKENEDTMQSIILGASQLTARGIPVAGEYEVKNAQAMKIMDGFGVGGSFTEYYAIDFKDDQILMGHDGPCHATIAEGKIKVKPLRAYHGKVGAGVSVEMSVKQGDVTLFSIVETHDRQLVFLVAEGESVSGSILEIGNTNSRYRFPIGARHFVEKWNAEGPAHHCAVGIGHIATKIEKLGKLSGIATVRIC